MKTLTALFGMALTGCSLLPVELTTDHTSHPTPTIVVYHGLGTTAATFQATEPYKSLITGLQAQGWDVIVPAYPTESDTDMAANVLDYLQADPTGQTMRTAWLNQYRSLNIHGPVVLLGISWGGLIAANIATSEPVDGLVLHLPALSPGLLDEFRAYDPTALTSYQIRCRSYVSWSTDDTRVGWVAAKILAVASGATTREYTSLGHSTTAAVVDDLLAYTAQVKP